ncbi:TRZ/ATZ family hydrolase [Acidiferrobacter sp. SPIII_3]|jgi:5-methylthioadenosine/S-adenosylhomocysteine deaminase|uniref:TRZ/ATZ family hydrolase n=1 Tax=Acidiferrobacter sp. SPIII_3 TaxID=1281578 RepID=UPI000D736507|nr:TRZ/ATZ family hydrolase [Acidiferrobacter sp. SPIII_3]AWP22735.1 TRZ/ATZ family hydrolase [Acidiferrobacter sp. SPIII_3]
MDFDLCLKAPWIIPVEPRGEVRHDHAVLIRDGRIAAIVPQAQAPQAAHTVDLPGHVLLPGLVNAHTHAAMTLFRGLADDLPLQQWLHEHIWPAEGRHVNADFARDGSALAALEMIQGGTTCFADMYFFADETARVATSAGLRAALGLVVIDVPTAWARDPEEYLSRGIALCDRWRHDALITPLLAPHAPYSVSDETLKRIRVRADELDIALHMHIHETAGEITQSLQSHGVRPLARLDRLGLIHANLMAVHMTQLTADEIALCAARGVSVVHCPESNLKIAAGICPVPSLVHAGVNVALGTDGAASNNDLDMLGEMRTAALLAKGTSGDATAVPAAVALEMATLNGARALGLGDDIGSLVVGKSADVIAIDLRAPSTQPVYDPLSQLVYAASRDQVTHAWVAGRPLLRDRQVLTLDERAIIRQAAAWRDKIRASDHGGLS